MPKTLVIVESPTKAKKIASFLGADYMVESSVGHIRDLPRGAADVPAAYKGQSWARLGVDVDNDFKPLYVVDSRKKDQIKRLKDLLKQAEELYLATDEDREGESIAWHLTEVLNPKVPTKRMVFHEITKPAIERALTETRDIDRNLVDAQEARRILDRLYGYEVSPVLWKKVMPRLSAGRVQSVATRIVVERERARMRFVPAGYWDLDATLEVRPADRKADEPETVEASLLSVDGKRLATGKDFNEAGQLIGESVALSEADVRALADDLAGVPVTVTSVETKPYKRSPYPPFRTSTLQVEAGRKLGFSSSRTMQVAQRLYENGFITYMRTDSTTLSDSALAAARSQIAEKYGERFLPAAPRLYANKVKNAQEAHEAIRPAGDSFRTPDQVSSELSGDEFRLYNLVWTRTVASQMADATGQSVSVRATATTATGRSTEFGASGRTITFPGFLRAYVEGADDPEAELDDREKHLPTLAEGQLLDQREMRPAGHSTQPPSRFTEPSLVQRLEELGIGRPSTYASLISTIQDRGYVWKKGQALVPTFTAFAVVNLLEKHFPELVDYEFTARMEDDLDAIAGGGRESIPWLSSFYFGQAPAVDAPGLKKLVSEHLGEIDAREINSIPLGVDADGVEIVARVGRYGPYLQRGEDTARLPDDFPPDELSIERSLEMLSAPKDERELGEDPSTGLTVFLKPGRFGPYVQLGELVDGEPKPRTASLFKTMSLDTVSLDDALQLLSLPRVVGNDPESGDEITAQNGRYGPYLKKGSDSRTIASEDLLFTISLEEALAIYREPKRRGAAVAKPPLAELGPDPVSGQPMIVKEGRFGPYVTDGETNASLRKGDDPETLTDERAAELLQIRRESGPAPKKAAKKKAAAKKAPAKKTTAKKAAKKA